MRAYALATQLVVTLSGPLSEQGNAALAALWQRSPSSAAEQERRPVPHDPYNPGYVLAPHDDGTWRRAQLLSQHRRRGEWRVTGSYMVDGYTFWRGLPAAECRAVDDPLPG